MFYKHFKLSIMGLLMCCLIPRIGQSQECIATGDLNGNGFIDVADITFLIDALFINFSPLSEPWLVDVNGDCVVDSADFVLIWDRFSLCLFPELPCIFNTPTCCDPVFNPCCVGNTGNVDNDPDDRVDISDLTALIAHQFITFSALACRAEANIDGDPSGNNDIADLTHLIDHLFINFPPTAPCQ